VEFPVAITPEALEKLKAQFARKGAQGGFVRIGVKGGGCSGLEYVLKFDTEPTPYDLEKDFEGFRIVCDSKSAKFLDGATLVWTGNLLGGFQFDNPNADRQCGCGTSFTPKKAG
jgi:iron-sulfur cluster assembly protein